MTQPEKETKTTETETIETPGAIDTALTDAEKAEREFDKDRQRADQAEANFRKARADKDRLESDLQQQRKQVEDLSKEIAELKAVKGAEQQVTDQLPEIDPENATAEDYGRAFKQVGKLISDMNRELAQLKSRHERSESEHQQDKQQTAEQQRKNAKLNKVCDRLEKKHSAPGLRNKALELMQQRIDAGETPEGEAEAALMLDECFVQARQQSREKPSGRKKSEDAATDTGGGGGRPRFGNLRLKKGSLDDVAGQVDQALASTG